MSIWGSKMAWGQYLCTRCSAISKPCIQLPLIGQI
jgi:hypothetical protein